MRGRYSFACRGLPEKNGWIRRPGMQQPLGVRLGETGLYSFAAPH
jgi:hypothetical protein